MTRSTLAVLGPIAVLVLFLTTGVPLGNAGTGGPSSAPPVSGGAHGAAASSAPAVLSTGPPNDATAECDGILWSSTIWAQYVPSYCYGHDEPTVSYVSNAPGSGEDASFRVTLPADGASVSQGDLYATIWFGGTVYDVDSTAGGNQAFLEFQFYPAAPGLTGANSGSQDCGSDGSFYPVFSPGSNDWFACVIVWQLQSTSGGVVENAAIAKPLDINGSTDAILEMHSGDHLDINYSGVAQSSSQGWRLSVADTTRALNGSVTLVNGALVLSPYYSTAATGNTLHWGASNPGAIAFAYEIGHALNNSIPQPKNGACYPGDGVCPSYWPGYWSRAGQMDLELPTMGTKGSITYPSQIVLSSSQGGEYEVNDTSYSNCGGHPSFSTATNCLYPWFQYRSGFYGFTFGTSNESNQTYGYGGEYQFPATTSGGQWKGRTEPAPWGTIATSISPLTATVEFNRIGSVQPLAVGVNGSVYDQFEEGPYWFNESAPGCTAVNSFVYLATGAVDHPSGALSCTGYPPLVASVVPSVTSGTTPLTVQFTGSATGGSGSYSYSWSFGDGGTSTSQNPSHTYNSAGQYTVVLNVTDSTGTTAAAGTVITVSAPLSASASANRTVGTAPLSVRFSGSASGGSPPYAYSWTFGDGGSSSLQSPTHTYATAGNYTAQLTVTDSKAVRATSSVSIHVSNAVEYAVYFNETSLPSGTNWSVTAAGSTVYGTSASHEFILSDGTYPYSVRVTNTTFRPNPPNGSLSVAGAGKTVLVVFDLVTYELSFNETGLPSGLSWTVHLGGLTNSSTAATVGFAVTNGTYGFGVTPPPGYASNRSTGSVQVAGTSRTVAVGFSALTFSVSFEASGLPVSLSYSIRLDGASQSSTGGWVNFTAPDGTHPFQVTAPAGYNATPPRGNVTVSDANQTFPIQFTPILYAVTFIESGLPAGTAWSVTLGGTQHNTTGTAVTLALANGSTPYHASNETGYSVANGTGIVEVVGGPVTVDVRYTAMSSPGGSSGLGLSTDLVLGLLAVALLVAGGAIYAVGARRRRREPPST
jgi:PKD repeat protein